MRRPQAIQAGVLVLISAAPVDWIGAQNPQQATVSGELHQVDERRV